MNHRKALAIGGLLLLAVLSGCSAAGSLGMQPAADDGTLAELTSRSTTVPDEGPVRSQQLVQRAVENGSTTAESRDPLVEPGRPFAHEGQYYNISWSVIDRNRGVAVDIAIDYNGTATGNDTVAYGNLSASDRERIDELLPPRTTRRSEGYDFGITGTYNQSEQNRSVLLAGDYDAVRYEGETYSIEVEDPEPVTTRTYRYTATVVANSTEAYASQIREQYLFTLSELSDDERAVVEEALNDTYYADSDSDDAFQSVLETFAAHEPIEADEYDGTWLVRYDGEIYLADLSYEQFDVMPERG